MTAVPPTNPSASPAAAIPPSAAQMSSQMSPPETASPDPSPAETSTTGPNPRAATPTGTVGEDLPQENLSQEDRKNLTQKDLSQDRSTQNRSTQDGPRWRQGALVDLEIDTLSDSGEGVGRWRDPADPDGPGRVAFVPDAAPGDRARVRLVQVKRKYARGKLQDLLTRSPQRTRPACIVADKCGGCQWQHLSYEAQLAAKQQQVVDALVRIGGFDAPPVDPILPAPEPLHYRNKSTYPVAPGVEPGSLRAGYYQKGSHKLVNLNQCPVQDARLDPILARVKQDIQTRGWAAYDETDDSGQIKHLSLRIGRRTGEVLLTLVVKDWVLPGIEAQANQWMADIPGLVGVCLNRNPRRTNVIFGDRTRCMAGRDSLTEVLDGLSFRIGPDTFFQVATEQTEALLGIVRDALQLSGEEVLVDAYCGVGTLTLPLARHARQVVGLELQPEAIAQATLNAGLNGIANVTFCEGPVEELLPYLDEPPAAIALPPDAVLLDPPRRGCKPEVLETLLELGAPRIAYMSCKPSTLARDLQVLAERYQLDRVQPADFFPQTAHVECVAFLSLRPE